MFFSTLFKKLLFLVLFLPLSLAASQRMPYDIRMLQNDIHLKDISTRDLVDPKYTLLEPLLGTWQVSNASGSINETMTITEVYYEDFYGGFIALGSDQNGYMFECLTDNGFFTTSSHTYICWNYESDDALNDVYYNLNFVGDALEGMYYKGDYDSAINSFSTNNGEPISVQKGSVVEMLNSNLVALKNRLLSIKNYTVSGNFAQYDFFGVDMAFDWTFTTPNNQVYQLQGIAPTSNDVFGWKLVQVTPNQPMWYMIYLGDWDSDGSGKYDWVLVGNGFDAVYKLEGVSATGNFAYSEKIDLAFSISSDKKSIIFGTSADPSSSEQLIQSQTIGSEGGTIDGDDFSLDILPGVFHENSKLDLYEVHEVFPFDDSKVTNAYRLKGLPDDYDQMLVPDIKLNATLSDESFVVVADEVLIPSLSTMGMAYHLLPATDVSGSLSYDTSKKAKVLTLNDDILRSSANDNFLDFFGITGWSTYEGAQSSRSEKEVHFSIKYPTYWVSRSDLDPLFQYLEEAYSTYESMGFSYGGRTNWPIEVVVLSLSADTYGLFCLDVLGNNYVTLQFNQHKLGNLPELRNTVGHEFFHFVQYLYDSRNKISRNSKTNARTISIRWLNEATAVWAEEKFTNIANYISTIRSECELAPFNGMEAGSGGDMDLAGEHGYGMSAFIKYLVQNYGESIVRDIYLGILEQKHPVAAIDSVVNNNLRTLWATFLREYVVGGVYNVPRSKFVNAATDSFQIKSKDDTSKSFTQSYSDLSAKLFSVYLRYPDLEKGASIQLKINQDKSDITVFKMKDTIEYLDHSTNKTLIVPNIRELMDDGFHLLIMVTNANYASPYTNKKSITLDVEVAPTIITLTTLPSTVLVGGSSTITATVTDAAGTLIKDETVDFTVSSGTLSSSSVKTDSNGVATVTFTAPSSSVPTGGVSTITAVIPNSVTTATSTITINQGSNGVSPTSLVCKLEYDGFSYQYDFNNNPDDNTYVACLYGFDGSLDWQEPYVNGVKDGIALGYYYGVHDRKIEYKNGEVISDIWL